MVLYMTLKKNLENLKHNWFFMRLFFNYYIPTSYLSFSLSLSLSLQFFLYSVFLSCPLFLSLILFSLFHDLSLFVLCHTSNLISPLPFHTYLVKEWHQFVNASLEQTSGDKRPQAIQLATSLLLKASP